MVRKKTSSKSDMTGLLFPAGIFIGMGFGLLTGQLPAGIFLGMGFGFLAMFFSKRQSK